MKTEVTSLGSKVVFCAVVMSLVSSVYAGGSGGAGTARHIQKPIAKQAAKASATDGQSQMSGSLFHPSRGSANREAMFKDLFNR